MNTKTYNIRNTSTILPRSRRQLLIIGTIVLLALLTLLLLEATNRTNFVGTRAASTQTANQSTKGEPADKGGVSTNDIVPTAPASSKADGNSPATNDKKPEGTAANTAKLLAPTGNFVSNYQPSLGDTPGRNTLNSVCTTTPGASCYISFTKGSETKKMETRMTDKGGAAYWTWTLQDVGLSEGAWNIKAVAALGERTESTLDALPLEVKP